MPTLQKMKKWTSAGTLLNCPKPQHALCPVFRDPVAPAKQQHEVVKRPSPAPRREVLDREEMPPAARHRRDEMRNKRERMTAPDRDRVSEPRAAPKPHRYKPAIQQAASVAHGLIFSFRQ
jgi:hypothetical protein